MDKEQKGQAPEPQQSQGEQNPTLNQAGSSVADYGNVMGGSSDATVQQGKNESEQGRSGDDNQTLGNP